MNKRIIYALLAVLVVLIVASYALRNLDKATSTPETLNELQVEFDPELVTRIDVYKEAYPDSGLHFAKAESDWVIVNEFNSPAKEEDIEKLLTDLNEVRGSVRAETADLYDDFEISDEQALQIELLAADSSKLLHLYVGKGSGGRECFVRLAGSPTVYLADNNFISRFAAWNAPPEKKLPTNRWLELGLCDIDRNAMTSYKITSGKNVYEFAQLEEASEDTLTPPTKVWKQIAPDKGKKLEESQIKSLSSSLAGIRGSAVVDPSKRDEYGLDGAKYVIWAADDGGNTAQIAFGDKTGEDDDRYVSVEGRDTVYLVKKSTFERFFVKPFEAD
jgi:hypothetical protein